MSAEHEELARLIMGRTTPRAVAAILEAGYRRTRAITDHYAETGTEVLPSGSVILSNGEALLAETGGTFMDPSGSTWDYWELDLPITVIHETNGGPPCRDRATFDDEANERAAKAICAAEFPEVSPTYAWNVQFEDGQNHYRNLARVALAAGSS